MHDRSLQQPGHRGESGARPREIGRGSHGTIQLDPDTMVVCKRLSIEDPEMAASLARREFAYLERFSAALRSQPFVRCPEPVSVDPDHGVLRMTYCPGVRLDDALADGNDAVLRDLDHIAEQIAIGVDRFIDEFGEPCFSLSTNNMVFDPTTRTLYLIDFTSARELPGINPSEVPVDVSLGCFIGVTTYHTVRIRPPTWVDRGYWRRQQRFSVAVLRALGSTRAVSPALVREIARHTYRTLAIHGRPLRRLWYSSIGRMLFTIRSESVIRGVEMPMRSAGSSTDHSAI